MAQAKQSIIKTTSYRSQSQDTAIRDRQTVYRVAPVRIPSTPTRRMGILVSVPQRPQISLRALFQQSQTVDATRAAIEGYELRNGDQVWQFLHDHAYLLPLLTEAKKRIESYFPGASLALEVATDPESVSSEQLVAIIIETTSPQDAFDRLERFDREWWISAVRQARGKLCITVEFA